MDFLSVTIPRFVSLWISGFLGHLRSLRRPCYPLGQPHVPYTGFLCKQKAAEIYRVDLNMTRLQIRFDPPSIQAWWSSAIIPYTPHTMHGLGGLENTELPTLPSNFSKTIPRESSFICRPFRGRQFLQCTVAVHSIAQHRWWCSNMSCVPPHPTPPSPQGQKPCHGQR